MEENQSLTGTYEVTFDYDEFDDGETVEQVIVDDKKYIDIEYFARVKADLKAKLAECEKQRDANYEMYSICWKDVKHMEQQLDEKEKELNLTKKLLENYRLQCHEFLKTETNICNQDKISFAVDVLEEIADCSNYINSKLDFECGSYVSEKAIRDKIKYLKGKKDE